MDLLQGYSSHFPDKTSCAPTWLSDTCHLLTLMCGVARGKQLTWVEEKPPLGFCWLLIHFAIRAAEDSSSWAGAGCEVRWARST